MKPDVLQALLPDLVRGDAGRRQQFGHGLAEGTENPPDMWQSLVDTLATAPEAERNVSVLCGFLLGTALRDSEVTDTLLDVAIDHPILGPWFPVLQSSVKIDDRGARRLESALDVGLAPIWTYSQLSGGRATDLIPASALRRIILKVASESNGYRIAVKILMMRLFSSNHGGAPSDNELLQCGRDLLKRCSFELSDRIPDYDLGEIVKTCFIGDDADEDATNICRQLKSAFTDDRVHPYYCKCFLASLFHVKPLIALDEFLGDQVDNKRHSLAVYLDLDRGSPLDEVPTEILIKWSQTDPEVRFPRLASVVTPFVKPDKNKDLAFTPTVLQLLSLAPDRAAILKRLGSHFEPSSWKGSLADILEKRRALCRTFLSDPDAKVVDWARQQDAKLGQLIEQTRMSDRRTDESFE